MKFKITTILLMILPNFILAQAQQANEMGLDQKIDKAFKPFSDFVSNVVFFEVFNGAPFVILLLVLTGLCPLELISKTFIMLYLLLLLNHE